MNEEDKQPKKNYAKGNPMLNSASQKLYSSTIRDVGEVAAALVMGDRYRRYDQLDN